MKKTLAFALALILAVASLAGCGKTETEKAKITIGVPNDTTNEARALLLLEANGIIKLKEGVGLTATAKDIVENKHNVEIVELEAAQLPRQLQDLDYAIINSNYAINAGINPVKDSLLIEGSASAYVNIISCKAGEETSDKIKALVAAVQSEKVKEEINKKYDGAVVAAVENPTDGYDATVDYDALAGTTIKVAASPTPHAELLAIAKDILAAKNITLEIVEYDDYVQPNNVVESGELDANYFQHVPYMDSFNEENGTHIVNAGGVHVEPMGLYGGKQKTLDALK